MRWEFSFSLWIINGGYVSDYNSSLYTTPDIIEIDDCGPSNLISAGYALWLVLVPAVACVVQLPGSLFLFRRSNFYRFSPELGIVDTLAVLSLFAKALWRGYRWDESIAAVFAVRDGIGRGDLWWRTDLEELSRPDGAPETQDTESAEVDNDGNEHTNDSPDERIHDFLTSKFDPILVPLSQERVLGAILFVVAFIKIIAIFKATANSGIMLSCYLALAYSASYMTLEIMTWSVVFPLRNNSLKKVPLENLLEVVKLVDPGDNPFTFPDSNLKTTLSLNIPMANLVSSSNPRPFNPSNSPPNLTTSKVPWNKAVAVIIVLLGVIGPLMWLLILSHIWSPARGALILTITAIAFLFVRLAGKWVYATLRHTLLKPDQPNTESGPTRTSIRDTTRLPSDPFIQYNTHGALIFFMLWIWHRITVVNLYSATWIVVICYYFAKIFPANVGLSSVDGSTVVVPQKPMWLDWLG